MLYKNFSFISGWLSRTSYDSKTDEDTSGTRTMCPARQVLASVTVSSYQLSVALSFEVSFLSYSLQVTKFRPKDRDANLKYLECKKIVQRQAFEKAIAVDDKKSVADTVDLKSMGQ